MAHRVIVRARELPGVVPELREGPAQLGELAAGELTGANEAAADSDRKATA